MAMDFNRFRVWGVGGWGLVAVECCYLLLMRSFPSAFASGHMRTSHLPVEPLVAFVSVRRHPSPFDPPVPSRATEADLFPFRLFIHSLDGSSEPHDLQIAR